VEFGARAATDVTGFGLIGHAAQMADASRVSMRLTPRKEWFLPHTLELAAAGVVPAGLHKNRDFFGPQVGGSELETGMGLAIYDPQTSGGLLIAVPARRAAALVAALKRRRVWVATIGEVTKRGRRSIEILAS
jgi:selenide,water dikinase